MNKLKSYFKVFERHPDLVYFDTAASAQKLSFVVEGVSDFLNYSYANINRGFYDLAEKSTLEFEKSREKVAKFLNTSVDNIVFTKSATESINLVAFAWAKKQLGQGDEIILTVADHHANVVPWVLLSQEIGFKINWIELDESGFVDEDEIFSVLENNNNVKFISLFGVSNVLGQSLLLEEISSVCRLKGIRFLVDGCQMVVHEKVDVQSLGCDWFVFSSHKLYAPSGVGVLYVNSRVFSEMGSFLGGGDAVESVSKYEVVFKDLNRGFEVGTPNIEGVYGLGLACEFLSENFQDIQSHESSVMKYLEEKLFALDYVEVIGEKTMGVRKGLISFNVKSVHAHDVAEVLGSRNIAVRAGQHCAHPLYDSLGISSSVRVSLGMYNTLEDVDRLLEGLDVVYNMFKR